LAAIEGSNPIAPARFAGAALVALLSMVMVKRIGWLVAAAPAIGTAWLLWGTGSRGPLIAAAVSLMVVALLLFVTSRERVRVVLVTIIAASMALYYFANSTTRVRERTSALLANDKGQSVYEREHMWPIGVDVFQNSPLGVGWGGLAPDLYPISHYPHNMFIETAAEGGVIALAALVVVLSTAYVRVFQHARAGDWTAMSLFALLTFWLTNAMVSGDLNDNRGVFILAGTCIALGRRSRAGQLPHSRGLTQHRDLPAPWKSTPAAT
jgi:O-antigen ligase